MKKKREKKEEREREKWQRIPVVVWVGGKAKMCYVSVLRCECMGGVSVRVDV